MVLQDAFEAAQRYLDERIRPEHQPEIVICTCTETDDGWEFGYQTRAWIEDENISLALAGNQPVFVPKSGAAPYLRTVWPPSKP